MESNADDLLRGARADPTVGVGRLLEQYRRYLALLARVQIGQRLQGKVDASDLVQETFLEAHQHFPSFQGTTEAQFLAWLRQILATRLADVLRRYLGTQRRDIRLEREIADAFDRSSAQLAAGLVFAQSSPSQQAVRREQTILLAEAMEQLPPDYRDILVLRHLEGLTFPEAARRMGRSVDSVEKLWLRGLAQLKQIMGGTQ